MQPAALSRRLQVEPAALSRGLQVEPAALSRGLQVEPAPVTESACDQASLCRSHHAPWIFLRVRVLPPPRVAPPPPGRARPSKFRTAQSPARETSPLLKPSRSRVGVPFAAI